ncbi:hypothetical protein [Streptomyces tagetis]|uniref:Uncharacterized protein n=1 Tax=Streptomyces tagetis TaxID=2820809 RepID=A0A940XE90_9ACTN|nr:hypothetical protein [Streptomyces sp. RG38]MBQ0826651.1 hypothetical protein [Streptomyces sp. RG38]
MEVVFSSGRQIAFEIGDFSEFGLGEGQIKTPEIPVGEFVSATATIGSHNPIMLIQPTLTLDPVIGWISAEEVARNRADEAESAESRTRVGAFAAAAGGIAGGLAGMTLGGAVGTVAGALLGPAGVLGGRVIGAGVGAKRGAEAGGALAGNIGESLYDLFHGDFDVTAQLKESRLSGKVGLRYTPFVRLSFALTGFEWLAKASVELQTVMYVTAAASFGMSGGITLRFRDGKLVRSVFTLNPSASLALSLEAEARLKLVGSLLNIMEESAGRGPSLFDGEYTTPTFHLFDMDTVIGAEGAFTFAKGSPMEILGRNIRLPAGAAADLFGGGLKKGGRNIPVAKRLGALAVKKRDAEDDISRTGKTKGGAILMVWYKSADWYPRYLTRPSVRGRQEKISMFPHHVYDNGLAMGVDFWPHEGMKFRYRGGVSRGSGMSRFKRELEAEGIELGRDLAYKADIDHVVDLAFDGPDDETNLWPLYESRNRGAGSVHRTQKVWWTPEKGDPPQKTALEKVPTGRWFEIKKMPD